MAEHSKMKRFSGIGKKKQKPVGPAECAGSETAERAEAEAAGQRLKEGGGSAIPRRIHSRKHT